MGINLSRNAAILSAGQVVGMTPTSRCGAAGSSRRKELEDGGASAVGWSLRLLLSLENTESTRTRLLVTEVLGGIIQDILDAIPGQVRRKRVLVCFPSPRRVMKKSLGVTRLPLNSLPPPHLIKGAANRDPRGRHACSTYSQRCKDHLLWPLQPTAPPTAGSYRLWRTTPPRAAAPSLC